MDTYYSNFVVNRFIRSYYSILNRSNVSRQLHPSRQTVSRQKLCVLFCRRNYFLWLFSKKYKFSLFQQRFDEAKIFSFRVKFTLTPFACNSLNFVTCIAKRKFLLNIRIKLINFCLKIFKKRQNSILNISIQFLAILWFFISFSNHKLIIFPCNTKLEVAKDKKRVSLCCSGGYWKLLRTSWTGQH